MAESDKAILTTGEAAALCGVSRSALRRAVAQGHLQAWHTPGKHLRFTRAACLEFARSLGRVDLIGQTYAGAPPEMAATNGSLAVTLIRVMPDTTPPPRPPNMPVKVP